MAQAIKVKLAVNGESVKIYASVKYPDVTATVHYFDGSYFVSCSGWDEFELASEKEAIARAKKMITSNVEDMIYASK